MRALYGAPKNKSSAPGVRFEETAPKKRSALQTGIPLFVGFGQISGQRESTIVMSGGIQALEITSREEFEQGIRVGLYGGFLDYAVRGFFQNGGQRCVVVPLPEIAGMPRALEKLFEDKGMLEEIEDVDLVCVPDIMAPEAQIPPDRVTGLQQQVLAYCRRMGDRFAILDAARIPGADEPGGLASAVRNQDDCRRQLLARQSDLPNKGGPMEGAIYFPWIHVKPLPRHRRALRIRVPPCGHIAGIYARSDAAFGVHKAPANEIIEGAMDLDAHLSDEDQVELNDFGVNCLRSFPGRRGIRVWGARTLSGRLDWKYVNVRRLFLTLVRWSAHHLDDLIFEPNGEPLWRRVRDRVGNYCYELYQSGALKGQTSAEAYFVKCDAETNPLAVRANGQLICDVGLAPVVPAEFIVVRITQSPAGATATIPTGT